MTVDEIINYCELGQWASVCVDIKELPEYPNYARTVVFCRNNQVSVEFYALVYDVHTAILDYRCTFDSPESAVESIEKFLKKPVQDWTNYNKTGDYPIYVKEEASVEISQN